MQQLLNYLHRKVAWGHFFRLLHLGEGHVCHLPHSTKVCKHQQADAIIPSFEGVSGNRIFEGRPQLRQADLRKVHCVFYIYTRHQGRLCTAFCIDVDVVICKIIFERNVLIAQHVKDHRTCTYPPPPPRNLPTHTHKHTDSCTHTHTHTHTQSLIFIFIFYFCEHLYYLLMSAAAGRFFGDAVYPASPWKPILSVLGIVERNCSFKAVKYAPTAKHHLKITLVITTCNERKIPTFSSDSLAH